VDPVQKTLWYVESRGKGAETVGVLRFREFAGLFGVPHGFVAAATTKCTTPRGMPGYGTFFGPAAGICGEISETRASHDGLGRFTTIPPAHRAMKHASRQTPILKRRVTGRWPRGEDLFFGDEDHGIDDTTSACRIT
jgi:hypothetical protein